MAQGTAFTFQGQLLNAGLPANGSYNLTFTLFTNSSGGTAVAGPLTNFVTFGSDGLFTTRLDFGASVFNGSTNWLEIGVLTSGSSGLATLSPRQELTPAPYAIFSANASNAITAASAATVPAGGIVGTIPISNLSTNVALLTANGTLPANVLPTNLALPGGIVWQSPPATTVQAQPNMNYLLTNSQQVTITLPAAPNVGDIIEVAGVGSGGWVLAQNLGQTIAASFTLIVHASDAVGNWYSIASSSDGTKLAAVLNGSAMLNGGGIWTSPNSGTNWAQTSAPTTNGWNSIASSSDGTKLAAVGGQGGIWTSINSGTSWVQTSAPSKNWQSIASSSDGTKLAAVISGGGIWTSTNSGANWGQTSAPTTNGWNSIASSSDGTKLAAVGIQGGIWTSSNSGTSWVQTGAPSETWQSIATSSDGTKLAAVISGGAIWTFVNGVVSTRSASASGLTSSGPAGFLQGSFGTVVELVYAGGGQFIALYQNGSFSGR